MGHNWGSLYWQLDDCWPVASWSSIDYYGRWKALQYFARKFFAPVLVSPVVEKGVVSIWGVSDRRADARARLTARLIDFSGNALKRFDQGIQLAANASRTYMTFKESDILKGVDPSKVVLVTELEVEGAPAAAQPALLQEDEGPRSCRSRRSSSRSRPARTARSPSASARSSSRATSSSPPARSTGSFDDNYFDVLPGETVTVTFKPRAPTTPAALQAALTATSIADTY